MVSETIGHHDAWSFAAAQRIADFQIALAARYLSGVSPRRCGIVAEGIVHPFADFMRSGGRVQSRYSEQTCRIEIHRRIGLGWIGVAGAVVAQEAAVVQVGGIAIREHRVIEEENRERA